MASTNPYGGGGGIGGKMRRRPTRSSQSTPYDRPPATPRTPTVVPPPIDGSNGWLSKIMDPASRLLSGSASKILTSVFRKSLPAPPQVPASSLSLSPEEMHQEAEEELVDQLTTAETPAERELAETLVERELAEVPDEIKSVSEIEQLLVQKTFTKEQFEHLTELLRARVVEPRLSEPAQIGKGKEAEANIPRREYVAENSRKNVIFATPANTVLIPKDEIASPMEVAKAYMSSKSSKVSPTTLRLRTPVFVERKPALPNSTVLHTSMKPPTGVATTRPGCLLSDQVKDAYPTPRSLGRTAISRMCRSPFVKSGGLSSGNSATKFLDYDAPMGSTPGSKLALKRGSSALYDEIGSVGPIRRIRQKLNMTTTKESAPSPYKSFAPTNKSGAKIDNNHASASTQKYLQLTKLNQGNDESTCDDGTEKGETEPENTRIPCVPPRSTETAMKILNQLDKISQSPKDKRTQNTVLEIEASSSQKQEKPKVDPPKLIRYDEKISFQGNGVGMIGSGTAVRTSKSVFVGTSSSAAVPKSTKPAFRMSVSEEFLDDDDEEANDKKVEATVPVKNVFDKVESGTSMQRKVESKIPEEKAATASETKGQTAPTTKPDESILSAAPVSETNGALKFTSPANPPVEFDFPSVPVSPTASLDFFAKKDDKYPSPIFSTGLKQQEKPENPVFPWLAEKIGAKADSGFPTTEALGSDRSGEKRKSEDAGEPTESSVFSTSPSLVTQVPVQPAFSFDRSTTPDLSNGSAHSSPTFSISSVPAVASATQPSVASSTAAFTITASPNDSSAAVEIPKPSFVQFGASNAASSQALASPLLDDARTKASDTSTVKPFAFGGSPSFNTAGATAPSTLTTSSKTTGLFSSNVAGLSTSVTLNTPTYPFGSSEKNTTAAAPTFTLGSSATTSSPSAGLVTLAATAPVSTSATANESTTSATPTVTFGSSGTSGAFTFSAPSQPAHSSSQAAPFAFAAAAPSSNSGASIFGFGASNQNTSSSTSMPSTGSSQSTFGFGTSSGSVFGSKPAEPESTGTQSYLQQSQSSNSQFSFPFSSAASSPVIFGASSGGFSFTSTVGSSSSTPASTSQSSMFGLGSSGTPSVFGTATFGSNTSGSTFTLGQSSSTASTSFSFGGQSSSPGFSFNASSSSTAPSFGLSNPNTNSSTLFGSVSPGTNNDQMSMEDSMVDDTNQVATANPPAPVFGQAASPVPLFGALSGSAPAPAFQFGAQPSQSLFQPGSNLEFNAGNQVSGSGASDKANRRYVKPSRSKMRRK